MIDRIYTNDREIIIYDQTHIQCTINIKVLYSFAYDRLYFSIN